MKLRYRAAAVVAAASTIVAIGLPARATAPGFTQTLVDKEQLGTEPAVRVDRASGYEYVTAVGDGDNAGNVIWYSRDGGATWTKGADTGGGGGDSDFAFDRDGRLYVLDLFDAPGSLNTTIPYAISTDHGATYARTGKLDPNAGAGIAWDRQWIAAKGSTTDGTNMVIATADSGGETDSWVSRDAGATWSGPHVISSDVQEGGPIIFGPDGAAYTSSWTYNGNGDLVVNVARSTDGVTWTSSTVATQVDPQSIGYKGVHWPVIAADSAGNLFVTWARGQVLGIDNALNSQVFVSTLPVGSAQWTAPQALSDPSHAAIFPWIAADGPGEVDVAWYQAQQAGGLPDVGPDLGGPQTTWDALMAQSVNATAAAPTYTTTTAASAFHTGSICTGGLEACPGPQQTGVGNVPTPFDRRDLDFFTIDFDSAGNAVIVYPKDRALTQGAVGDLVLAWSDIYVARQTSGSTIAAPTTTTTTTKGHKGPKKAKINH